MKFGNRSKKRLSTCDEDLQKIMNLAIQRTIVDFGITEGHRSVERQQELFNQRPKVTHVDGVNIKSSIITTLQRLAIFTFTTQTNT